MLSGVLGWSIEAAHGGSARDLTSLLNGYERIASACLTSSFILSQRESATRHLHGMADSGARHELLASLASGAGFATVGLSQLTTSRQHQQPGAHSCAGARRQIYLRWHNSLGDRGRAKGCGTSSSVP